VPNVAVIIGSFRTIRRGFSDGWSFGACVLDGLNSGCTGEGSCSRRAFRTLADVEFGFQLSTILSSSDVWRRGWFDRRRWSFGVILTGKMSRVAVVLPGLAQGCAYSRC
jgi:hypothetical protein